MDILSHFLTFCELRSMHHAPIKVEFSTARAKFQMDQNNQFRLNHMQTKRGYSATSIFGGAFPSQF